jgi:hypothetical protein
MRELIYLSGPISSCGDMEENRKKFSVAANKLAAIGKKVINPASTFVEGWEWADYMAIDLTFVTLATKLVMLPGWQHSKGARIEHALAKELHKQVEYMV